MIEFYTPQKDLGTPESAEHEMVSLYIDGKSVEVKKGTSVTVSYTHLTLPTICSV